MSGRKRGAREPAAPAIGRVPGAEPTTARPAARRPTSLQASDTVSGRKRGAREPAAPAIGRVPGAEPMTARPAARRPAPFQASDAVSGRKRGARDPADLDAILARRVTDPAGPEFMAPPSRKA